MRIDYGPTVTTDVIPDGCRVAARECSCQIDG
jgi:hypothetical protein